MSGFRFSTASVIIPSGWKVATALRPTGQSSNRIDYPVTSYEILMDSPLIAGAHYRRIPLTNDVALDVIPIATEGFTNVNDHVDLDSALSDLGFGDRRIAGRHDSLGRPVLYGTTKKFLQVFGLKSLRDLPMNEQLKLPDRTEPEVSDERSEA